MRPDGTSIYSLIRNIGSSIGIAMVRYRIADGGKRIGSLLLGVQGAAGLEYAGHVGTGFTDAVFRRIVRHYGGCGLMYTEMIWAGGWINGQIEPARLSGVRASSFASGSGCTS